MPGPQVAAGAPHAPAGWNPQAAVSGNASSSMSSDGSTSSGGAAAAVPEVLLGVVASDVRLAVRSLRDYCQALGLPFLVGGRMGSCVGDWVHFSGCENCMCVTPREG